MRPDGTAFYYSDYSGGGSKTCFATVAPVVRRAGTVGATQVFQPYFAIGTGATRLYQPVSG